MNFEIPRHEIISPDHLATTANSRKKCSRASKQAQKFDVYFGAFCLTYSHDEL